MDWHPKSLSSRSFRLGTSASLTATLCRRLTTSDTYLRHLDGGGKTGAGTWREKELKTVDKELARGNHKAALKLVKRMQGKPGGLRGFGAAKQVNYAKSSLPHLDIDAVDMSDIQPKVDSMLELIIESIQSAFEDEPPSGQKAKNMLSWELLHRRTKQHEAGHFIVAYLLGVLPRTYEVPRIDAGEENPTRGHVKMVDFASPLEPRCIVLYHAGDQPQSIVQGNVYLASFPWNLNKLETKLLFLQNLNKFSCIALGGLVAAYLEYGYTGGFVSDVDKLYIALNWLEFTESEAETYLRWAILNTSQMLLRHRIATLKLADAMALGRSIGYCIATIEDSLQKGLV